MSRETYDSLAALFRQQGDNAYRYQEGLQERLRDAQDCNRTLVQQIVEMRREGFAPVPTPHVPAPLLSSPVDDAILARANGNSRLRSHLLRQRDKLRKDGMADDEITERLTTFRDPDPDE